ncbi:MAG: hypothetical protein PHV51_10665, partial [Methanosarcinaceae archaeon]|nr:hypothetical protein [Methanosarcinaceae archaeon]
MNKKNKFSNIMILSIVFFFMLILSTGLSSAALNVTGLPGDGNCSSIQGAINNSSVGDTILVYDGTYTENLQVSVSGLTLKAVEGSNVILKPHPLDL